MIDFEKFYKGLNEDTRAFALRLYEKSEMDKKLESLMSESDTTGIEKLSESFIRAIVDYEKKKENDSDDEETPGELIEECNQDKADELISQVEEESCDGAKPSMVDSNEETGTDDTAEDTVSRKIDSLLLFMELYNPIDSDASRGGCILSSKARYAWLRNFAEERFDEWSKVDEYGKSKFDYAVDVFESLVCVMVDEPDKLSEFENIFLHRNHISVFIPNVLYDADFCDFLETLVTYSFGLDATAKYSYLNTGKSVVGGIELVVLLK